MRIIHDYKGRDVYHLIRGGKRYEFRIREFWIEQFNDRLPCAVGFKVELRNPNFESPLRDANRMVEMVLYVDRSEIGDIRDLLKSCFTYLGEFLWNMKDAASVIGSLVVSAKTHLESTAMPASLDRWNLKKVTGRVLSYDRLRFRLNLLVNELPMCEGQVVLTAIQGPTKFIKQYALDDFSEVAGCDFAHGSVSDFAMAIGGKPV